MTSRSQIVHADPSSEGLIVTFGDGHTFLFPDSFLFESRLRFGQMIESSKRTDSAPEE